VAITVFNTLQRLMDSSRFDRDVEQHGSNMSQKALNQKDGRRRVLIVGAGAAG
jgi:hypothetical protein